eukprot:196260_1
MSPADIISVIQRYFQGEETIYCASEGVKISNKLNTMVVVSNDRTCKTAYGSIAIPSQSNIHCYWKIKIDRFKKGNIHVGIVTKRITDKHYAWTDTQNIFYSFGAQSKDYCHIRSHVQTDKTYAIVAKECDVITVDLNLMKKRVTFYINDIHYGIIFDDITTSDDIDYYLALQSTGKAHQLTVTVTEFGERVETHSDQKQSAENVQTETFEIMQFNDILIAGEIHSNRKILFLKDMVKLRDKYSTKENKNVILDKPFTETTENICVASDNIKISNNSKTITKIKQANWSTAYGSIAVPSQSNIHCYWKIKLDVCNNTAYLGLVTKPIMDNTYKWMHPDGTYVWNIFYSFCGSGHDGWEIKQCFSGICKQYVVSPQEGDIITIDLNLRKKRVKFYVNDIDYGIIINHIRTGIDIDYYLALAVAGATQQLTIVEFGLIYDILINSSESVANEIKQTKDPTEITNFDPKGYVTNYAGTIAFAVKMMKPYTILLSGEIFLDKKQLFVTDMIALRTKYSEEEINYNLDEIVSFQVVLYSSAILVSVEMHKNRQDSFLKDMFLLRQKYSTQDKDNGNVVLYNSLRQRTKVIIMGFMRIHFSMVDEDVINSIVLYFHEQHECIYLSSENLEISNNHKTISLLKTQNHWEIAYGSICVPSQSNIHCYWKIKINSLKNGSMHIGVVTKRITDNKGENVWMKQKKDICYSLQSPVLYYSGESKTRVINYGGRYKEYSVLLNEGDIVTIDLNLRKKRITYYINDIDHDMVIDHIRTDDDIYYYLAFAVYGITNQLHLNQATVVEFGENDL